MMSSQVQAPRMGAFFAPYFREDDLMGNYKTHEEVR